eukprot:scaffold36545_cov87-Isochrysis_galbana.AAC.1
MLCDVFTPDICAAHRHKVTPHSTFEKLDDLSLENTRPIVFLVHIDGTACLPSAQKPSRRTPLKSSQFLPKPKIFAKTKNLPNTFPVGTSGYWMGPSEACDSTK